MIAFSLTPSSLLSKNGASLRNPSLSYQRWFYFCLFLLEQFTIRWFSENNLKTRWILPFHVGPRWIMILPAKLKITEWKAFASLVGCYLQSIIPDILLTVSNFGVVGKAYDVFTLTGSPPPMGTKNKLMDWSLPVVNWDKNATWSPVGEATGFQFLRSLTEGVISVFSLFFESWYRYIPFL